MISAQHKIKIRQLIAKWLIRFKKLKHVEYTSDEIAALVAEYLPKTFPVSVPRGQGSFTLMTADVSMPPKSCNIHVEVLSGFAVEYLANPIYRAHLLILLEARPHYDVEAKHVRLKEVKITNIKLLHDEYSLLKDGRDIIQNLVPSPVLSMFTDTMKTALSLVTGNVASDANAYLQLYLGGSKQRVLNYHKPQLEQIVIDMAAGDEVRYQLDKSNWEEQLFSQLGKEVVVEEGKLRFKF
ncbi:MAG: hypothetical protein ACI8Z9_001807 [Paraglaciecola sp.]